MSLIGHAQRVLFAVSAKLVCSLPVLNGAGYSSLAGGGAAWNRGRVPWSKVKD